MDYKGRLARRFPYRAAPGLLATKEYRDALYAQELADFQSRIYELFDFYGIARNDWMNLAMRLALEHVPGFQMERAPRGPPNRWGELARAELKVCVDDAIRKAAPRKMKPSTAIARLANREPWKTRLKDSKRPADALRKQYEAADECWVKIYRKAKAWAIYEADPNKDIDAATRAAGLDPAGN